MCLIIIPVCLFILDKRAGGYSYYFEIILTITYDLINEIQIFFMLCTILTESFNLIRSTMVAVMAVDKVPRILSLPGVSPVRGISPRNIFQVHFKRALLANLTMCF